MLPSLKIRIRLAKLAAYASCVTISIVVCNSSFASFKVFNNSVAEFESNAPVGSSANKILGCFTMALAADARCLCPQTARLDICLTERQCQSVLLNFAPFFRFFYAEAFVK